MKLAAAFLLFISLVAQANTTAQFAGLDQLVGHCWQATFPDGQKIDTHCFSEVYSGAFIKDQHAVCGGESPYYGETWYAFDSKNNKVTYRYYNSFGGVSDGSVEYKNQQLKFPDETYEKDGQPIVYRTHWTLSKELYQSQMWQQDPTQPSGWKKIWQMDFKKVNLNDQNIVQFNLEQQLHCHQTDQ